VATVDWIALAVVLVGALVGWMRGLVVSALSLGGLLGGAYAGSRIAPHLLHGGSTSPWTPFLGLVGALLGAALLQTAAAFVGSFVRGGLRLTPLRLVDSAGGFLLGAATGLVVVWVAGAAALLLPGQTTLRSAVQDSEIVQRLNRHVPPSKLLHLLARIDPFPSITGPAAPSTPAGPAIARDPQIRKAEDSVVRIVGTSCGVGVEGSGWFATRDMVVTAAHVVAGEHDTRVVLPTNSTAYAAVAVAFNPHDDIAVLRLLLAPPQTPLRLLPPSDGTPVAILGYPENGPLTATPGRIGKTSTVLTRDAYGNGPVERTITAIAGHVRHGNSGGPAVDRQGRVRSTIFAARLGTSTGYGIPAPIVSRALRAARQGPVSTGSCAG
jgi:S1-C subfamily serine protease